MESELEGRDLKSTVANQGGVALGLFALTIGHVLPRHQDWRLIALFVASIFLAWSFVILVFYVGKPHYFRRRILQKAVNILTNVRVGYLSWFLGFLSLGLALLGGNLRGLVTPGEICVWSAYGFLVAGIVVEARRWFKRRQEDKFQLDMGKTLP